MAEEAAVDRLLDVLGLARRAGRLATGTRAVLEAARTGELELAVVADDAGENALARLRAVLDGPAPTVRAADRERLGEALGRVPLVVVGVTDAGLARKVRRLAADAGPEDARTPRADGPYDPGDGGSPGGAEKSTIHAS